MENFEIANRDFLDLDILDWLKKSIRLWEDCANLLENTN